MPTVHQNVVWASSRLFGQGTESTLDQLRATLKRRSSAGAVANKVCSGTDEHVEHIGIAELHDLFAAQHGLAGGVVAPRIVVCRRALDLEALDFSAGGTCLALTVSLVGSSPGAVCAAARP